ncbi:hypothetical protein P5673_009094 [Acropora cervicornis]|uniref:Uncharacterized protein n=1 Tax=Acropora cervicornis TaxID=6130 RepID=A0AAD9QTI1_ACRCE|nr:hypothetical protein P5673_009094 [Acropora cervicornis]
MSKNAVTLMENIGTVTVKGRNAISERVREIITVPQFSKVPIPPRFLRTTISRTKNNIAMRPAKAAPPIRSGDDVDIHTLVTRTALTQVTVHQRNTSPLNARIGIAVCQNPTAVDISESFCAIADISALCIEVHTRSVVLARLRRTIIRNILAVSTVKSKCACTSVITDSVPVVGVTRCSIEARHAVARIKDGTVISFVFRGAIAMVFIER